MSLEEHIKFWEEMRDRATWEAGSSASILSKPHGLRKAHEDLFHSDFTCAEFSKKKKKSSLQSLQPLLKSTVWRTISIMLTKKKKKSNCLLRIIFLHGIRAFCAVPDLSSQVFRRLDSLWQLLLDHQEAMKRLKRGLTKRVER